MNNKAIFFVGFLIIAALVQTALAQPPIYAPYGAWRGRIRYVETPHRVRTHIRWGGGITPVGGQVLTNLATVAGNVFTNQGLLNAVTGGAIRDTRELDPEIDSINERIETKNTELLVELNKVRDTVGLPKLSITSPLADVDATTPIPDRNETNLTQELSDYGELFKETSNLRGEIKTTIGPVIKAVDALDSSDERKSKLEALSKLESFFSDASGAVDVGPIEPTAIDEKLTFIRSKLEILSKNTNDLISKGEVLLRENLNQEIKGKIEETIESAAKWRKHTNDARI